MPIRHCQKCGLKVLVDESQLAANPFYCQRCAATAKAAAAKEGGGAPAMMTSGGGGPAAPASPTTTSSAPAPTPAPTAPPGPARSIKVLCPYCKASFAGRVPAKPAKGSCPVCQKELVLLPDGSIAGGTEFNLADWKKQQEKQPGSVAADPNKPVIPIKLETRGTKIVRPKQPVAVEDPTLMAGSAAVAAPRAPGPKPDQSEIDAAFPGGMGEHTILDMGRPVSTPRGTAKPSAEEVEDAFPTGMGDQTMLGMGGAEGRQQAPPPPSEQEFPTGMGEQTMLGMGGMEREAAPPPPPRPIPIPPPPPPAEEEPMEQSGSTAEAPRVEAPPEPPPPPPPKRESHRAVAPASGGMGKVVVAFILMLIPPIAGAALYFMKENEGVKNLLGRISSIAHRGLYRAYEELTKETPPAPVPVKKEPEKKGPEKKEETPEEKEAKRKELKSMLQREITDAYLKIRKADRAIRSMPDPSEGQKKIIEEQRKIIEKQQGILEEKQALYKKEFGEDYKPQDEEEPPK